MAGVLLPVGDLVHQDLVQCDLQVSYTDAWQRSNHPGRRSVRQRHTVCFVQDEASACREALPDGACARVALNAAVSSDAATEAEFDETFAVNVKIPFFLVASLAPAMAEGGWGSIVNLSTMVASFGQPGMAMYGASRAALELLTKALGG